MNAVARAELAFHMLTLRQKYVEHDIRKQGFVGRRYTRVIHQMCYYIDVEHVHREITLCSPVSLIAKYNSD